MRTATFRIFRGDALGGAFQDYTTQVADGMVVLDAVLQIQAESAHDLAARWNCKAAGAAPAQRKSMASPS